MTTRAATETPKVTKGAKTALRIQDAAVDLVLQKGIDGTTVEQICALAQVSERTFFNYFKTKELAIIGDDLPTIDETRAREFLVAPLGDIFSDAMNLIPALPMKPEFHSLFLKRMQLMRKYPGLLAAQMEKMLATRDEHCELVYLRLRRTYSNSFSDEELRSMASQISEIVASLFRAQAETRFKGLGEPKELQVTATGEALRTLVELGLRA